MPKLAIARACAACILLAAQAAWCHEFWMQPGRFRLGAGEDATLSLVVGEYFSGGRVALTQPLFLALAQQAGNRAIDLLPQVPREGTAGEVALPVSCTAEGGPTQVLWADIRPAHLELEGGRFFAYLHDEGLDVVNAARERTGKLGTAGRERFRRHIKTLLRLDSCDASSQRHTTVTRRTGQTLEIVPLSDPYAASPASELGFQVFFDGKPLANALVKFWHRRGGQTMIVRTTTNAQGRVIASMPWAGIWMASVVHMTPAADSVACDCDWESYWGNLTFELPAR